MPFVFCLKQGRSILAISVGVACSTFISGLLGNAQLTTQWRSAAGQSLNSNLTAAAAPFDVVGLVVDARDRHPIARALVHFGNRAVLTDHDGVFTFPQVTSPSGTFIANKPGFYSSPDGDGAQPRLYRFPLTAPVELPLYPESILSGSVLDQSGEALSGVSISARRSVFDENGHHWYPIGQAQTSSSGEFRIAVPSGSYRLRISQRGQSFGGTERMLPLEVPAGTSSRLEAIGLLPGEEKRLEVRGNVQHSYSVTVRVDADARGFPSLTAKGTTGGSIPLNAIPSRQQGDLRVTLPNGTYMIHGVMQGPDGLLEGQTPVTVADHDLSGVVLHLSRAASLPVLVEPDVSASLNTNTKYPDANQLGLTLQSADEDLEQNGSAVRVAARKNGPPAFALADGIYRLRSQAGGQWYVSGATCGGIDLLTAALPVTAGLDGTEIRVRVSNNTATLSGKVSISGTAGPAWIYLLATHPSATPLIILHANLDGTFFRPYLAPGEYSIVALEDKVNANEDPSTLSRYLDRLQTLTIAPGEQHTMTLDAVPQRELSR